MHGQAGRACRACLARATIPLCGTATCAVHAWPARSGSAVPAKVNIHNRPILTAWPAKAWPNLMASGLRPVRDSSPPPTRASAPSRESSSSSTRAVTATPPCQPLRRSPFEVSSCVVACSYPTPPRRADFMARARRTPTATVTSPFHLPSPSVSLYVRGIRAGPILFFFGPVLSEPSRHKCPDMPCLSRRPGIVDWGGMARRARVCAATAARVSNSMPTLPPLSSLPSLVSLPPPAYRWKREGVGFYHF